jgi:alkylated DNA repair protein alkB family protein 1
VQEALTEWSQPPNLSNLDAHYQLPATGIWRMFVDNPAALVQPRIYQHSETHVHSKEKLLIDPPTDAMAKQQPRDAAQVLMRLRWVTLGYQYNWTEKQYFFDRSPLFPESLNSVVRDIVDEMAQFTGYPALRYKSEAGIVNFYHPGDSLTAHQDKSELNDVAPLVSCSIGLDAIFLIGTQSKDDEPVAIKLESGDVVLMSGPARRNYHGVPCVLPGTLPGTLPAGWDDVTSEIREFMQCTRINLNVRQVL